MVAIRGRTFVVSGGASGLGLATVKSIVEAGGYAAIVDLNKDAGDRTVEELGRQQASFFGTDVTSSESIASSVRDIVSWIGTTGAELGGVLCAAGIGIPVFALDSDGRTCNMEHFDKVLRVNVRGSIDLASQLLPYWTKIDAHHGINNADGDRGAIIFVSSIAAQEGQTGMAAYSASKGALAGATLPFTRELSAHNIRVVSLAPGIFETPMTQGMPTELRELNESTFEFPKRPGNPSDFAYLVKHVFKNVALNGSWLRIDGGMRMPRG